MFIRNAIRFATNGAQSGQSRFQRMIRVKSNFIQILDNLYCNKTFPNKNYSVPDLKSSLNSNTTFSFICHVAVLNFSGIV